MQQVSLKLNEFQSGWIHTLFVDYTGVTCGIIKHLNYKSFLIKIKHFALSLSKWQDYKIYNGNYNRNIIEIIIQNMEYIKNIYICENY